MNSPSHRYIKAIGLSLVFTFLSALFNYFILIYGVSLTGFFQKLFEPMFGSVAMEAYGTIFLIAFVIVNYKISKFLCSKYSTDLYGVVWIVTIPTSLMIITFFGLIDARVPEPLWALALAVILIIIFSTIFLFLESKHIKGIYMKVFSCLGLLGMPLLILLFFNLFPSFTTGCRMCPNPDSTIRYTLSNSRAHAEVYYDNHDRSYEGVCSTAYEDGGIKELIKQRGEIETESYCYDSGEAWAVEAKLIDEDKSYCVDSTSQAVITDGNTISESDMMCN